MATDALAALTHFGWTLPSLWRLELYIEPSNAPSVRVAQKCGYAAAGLLPAHTEIGGVRRDMLCFVRHRADDQRGRHRTSDTPVR